MKEYGEDYDKLKSDYNDVDREYQNVKNDIEMSRTPEEQKYWQSRADDLWNQRDELGYQLDTFDKSDTFDTESDESGQLLEDYKNADQQYKEYENDIEMSRSQEEKQFWESKAEESWNERDELDYQLETNGEGNDSGAETTDTEGSTTDTTWDNGDETSDDSFEETSDDSFEETEDDSFEETSDDSFEETEDDSFEETSDDSFEETTDDSFEETTDDSSDDSYDDSSDDSFDDSSNDSEE